MNDLSVIEENVLEQCPKGINGDNSEDSGLASSSNTSVQSGSRFNAKFERCIIIEFKALNERPETVKESTFLNEKNAKGSCNLSAIAAEGIAETINSEDGRRGPIN